VEIRGGSGPSGIDAEPRTNDGPFQGPIKCEAHRAKLDSSGDSTLRGLLSDIDPNNWHHQGLPQVVNTFGKHIYGMRGDSYYQREGGGTIDPAKLKSSASEREFWKFISHHLKSKNVENNTIHAGGKQMRIGDFLRQLDATIAQAEHSSGTPAYDRVADLSDAFESNKPKAQMKTTPVFDMGHFKANVQKRKSELQAVVGRNIETQYGAASGNVEYDRSKAIAALKQARADAQKANDVESNQGNFFGNLWRGLFGSRAGDDLHSEVNRLMEQYGVKDDELS
jgi:hypothetical protein